MVRVRKASVSEGFRVRVHFTDDTEKLIDLEPYLRGPIFEEIRKSRS